MIDSTERPRPPTVSFDWDAATWKEVGDRLLDLAARASTDWEDRRPATDIDAETVRSRFAASLPDEPSNVDALVDELADLLPMSTYNGHPRFYAYITSSAAPVAVLGDFLASALNQNTGGWRLAPATTAIELQTIDWIKEMLDYPAEAEGTFVSGGQFANVVAHAVARDTKAPWDMRLHGTRGPNGESPALRIYASKELHYCHQQAAEMLGLGRNAVREVPVDDNYRMNLDALRSMIAEDRARGDVPATIVGTAGTVGTGAVDPLSELAAIAREEGVWFHVDGAYGAFAVLAGNRPPALDGISEADSIACDPHKWLYAPIDAGVTLIREPGKLEGSFRFHPKYLETERLDAKVDMLERSPENSRPARALKVWLALRAFGRSGYRDMIEHNISLAEHMERLVSETPGLVAAAPRELSIVCWRVEPEGVPADRLEQLQLDVIAELERRGIGVVSNAPLLDGRTALRACIVNFRTTAQDVEALVSASANLGRELSRA